MRSLLVLAVVLLGGCANIRECGRPSCNVRFIGPVYQPEFHPQPMLYQMPGPQPVYQQPIQAPAPVYQPIPLVLPDNKPLRVPNFPKTPGPTECIVGPFGDTLCYTN